jgi:hypothetical protein
VLLSLAAIILASQMLLDGLCTRFFGKLCLLQPESTTLRLLPGPIFPHEGSLGWPYVLLATAWIGALLVLWLGLRWSAGFCAGLAGLSAALSLTGWILAVIIIACALHPATAVWLGERGKTGL